MRVRVTAPYVTLKVADRDGNQVVAGYQAGAIVDRVEEASLRHHLDRGMVEEEFDETAPPAAESESVDEAPAKSASKAEWVTYAESKGAAKEDAEKATKDELIEIYGS
jgi:hypothetical protein